MRTDLDHLPQAKRQELEKILEILFRGFEEATRDKTSPRKRGKILKAVLYGSYSRGDWVEDAKSGYRSDYDLLVVVSSEALTDLAEYWADTDEALLQAYQITHELSAPVQVIVHSLDQVNRELSRGRPFFVDLVRDGIALYEAPEHPFARPQKLSPAEAHKEAQGNFGQWFPSASGFLDTARYAASQQRLTEAAFQLHQAAERFYHCALLTMTLYSPLCRARHNGLYAERRTMPMAIDFSLSVRRLGGFRSA